MHNDKVSQLSDRVGTAVNNKFWVNKRFSVIGTVVGLSLAANISLADDPIKVGVLHSLSGTMAISETTLKDTMLMLVEQQNAKGGLLGKQLEAVVVDPASDWPLFAEKARELIEVNEVDAVFGAWTSVSRKSVLPVFEELNSLLFYCLLYTSPSPRDQRGSRMPSSA